MCFVDIIITICVQAARLRFVSAFTQLFVQLKCCVRPLKPTAFDMHFAGRDLDILNICFIHLVVITQNQQKVILKQISLEDYVY